MNRRELLIFSAASAFLSAFGAQQFATAGSMDRATSSNTVVNTAADLGQQRALIQQLADLLLSSSVPDEFLTDPSAYMLTLGHPEPVVLEQREIIMTVRIALSPDFKTAIAICDTSYLLGTAKRIGSNSPEKVDKLIAAGVADIQKIPLQTRGIGDQAKLSKHVGDRLRELIGSKGAGDIASTLILTIAYATILTEGLSG